MGFSGSVGKAQVEVSNAIDHQGQQFDTDSPQLSLWRWLWPAQLIRARSWMVPVIWNDLFVAKI